MRLPVFVNLEKNDKKSEWIHNHSLSIYFISLLSAFAVISLMYLLGQYFFQLILPALIISLLYPIKIQISNQYYSIREIPFIKIFLIAFTWSYVTFVAPLLYYGFEINYFLLDMFFQRFLFVVAISIPFDIRDCEYDQIKTIPNVFGIYQSKLFAWFCLFIIDLLLIIDVINHTISIPFFIALFLSIEICSVIIYYTNNNKSSVFYGVYVESLSIIMCLFVLIASLF